MTKKDKKKLDGYTSSIIAGIFVLVIYNYFEFSNIYFLCFGIFFIVYGVGSIFHYYYSKNKLYSNADLSAIDKMNGLEFENYVAFILEKNGYKKVKVTSATNDQGIDVVAYKNGSWYGFQCKRWNGNVGNKAIQEAFAGKGYYNLDKAVVITNSFYTQSAIKLASKLKVELMDRKSLLKLINARS